MPDLGCNLLTNPTPMLTTAGWTGQAGLLERVQDARFAGGWAFRFTVDPGVVHGNVPGPSGAAVFTVPTVLTASIDMIASAPVILAVHHNGAEYVYAHHSGNGGLERLYIEYVAPANVLQTFVGVSDNTGTHTSILFANARLAIGSGLEARERLDGSMDGCMWDGTAWASSSRRLSRSGVAA